MLTSVIKLNTKYGELASQLFEDDLHRQCVIVSNPSIDSVPFVRIQSSCVFSESFGGNDCDCALQLDASLRLISASGGYLFYLYDEGRGAGLLKKIEGISLEQSEHISTVEAYGRLGLAPDLRNYSIAIAAMKATELPLRIRLASNNPLKIKYVQDAGFMVEHRIKLNIPVTEPIESYLAMKREHLGHDI